MLLQLAEGLSRMPRKNKRSMQQINYVELPQQKIKVREDYFDRMPLAEASQILSENNYSVEQISQLAARRNIRKGGQVATPKQAIRLEKKRAKVEVIKGRAAKKQGTAIKSINKGEAKKIIAKAKLIQAQQAPAPEEDLFNRFQPDEADNEEPLYNEGEIIDTEAEEVPNEESEEGMSAPAINKAKAKAALIKGLKTTAAAYYKDLAPAQKAKIKKVYITTGKEAVKSDLNDTLFKIGNTTITKKQGLIAGAAIALVGFATTRPKRK